jgi:hypothetical protein
MLPLQQVADYVRSTIPMPGAIMQMRASESAGGVTFFWQGIEFFVRESLQVFELRGNTLFITGLSSLLQTVLSRRKLDDHKFNGFVSQLSEAEALARDPRSTIRAVEILQSIRKSAEQMVGRPIRTAPASPVAPRYPTGHSSVLSRAA